MASDRFGPCVIVDEGRKDTSAAPGLPAPCIGPETRPASQGILLDGDKVAIPCRPDIARRDQRFGDPILPDPAIDHPGAKRDRPGTAFEIAAVDQALEECPRLAAARPDASVIGVTDAFRIGCHDVGDDEDYAVLLEGATIEGPGLRLDADLRDKGVEEPGEAFVVLCRTVDPNRTISPDRLIRTGIGQLVRRDVVPGRQRQQKANGDYRANGNPPRRPVRRAEISPGLPEVEQGAGTKW